MGTAIVTGRPQVVWSAPAGGGQVTLVNLDVAQTIFLDYEYNVTAGSLQLGPLNSLSFDGGRPIYAACFSGQADLLVMPGATNWSPSPAQISAQLAALGLATAANQLGQNTAIPNGIAATGTPLLHGLANRLNNTSGGSGTLAVPAGSTIFPFVGGITKPGYIISISVAIANTATIPFLEVQMIWKDAVTGLGTAEEAWIIPAATSTLVIYGKGPTKGSELSIGMHNLDPAQAMTVTCAFWETTHHIGRDDWRSDNPNNVPGLGLIANPCDAFAGLLLQSEGTAAAHGGPSFMLPLYAGQVSIYASLGAVGNLSVSALQAGGVGMPAPYGGNTLAQTPLAAGTPVTLTQDTGRFPIVVSLDNTTAGAASYGITATILEYAS